MVKVLEFAFIFDYDIYFQVDETNSVDSNEKNLSLDTYQANCSYHLANFHVLTLIASNTLYNGIPLLRAHTHIHTFTYGNYLFIVVDLKPNNRKY